MTPRRVARAQPFTANRDLTTPPLTLCIAAEDKSLLVETFGGYLKKKGQYRVPSALRIAL
jgi:hypothetical protein